MPKDIIAHNTPASSRYANRFQKNLKDYYESIGLVMIGVFIISITMCYYLVDYFFFNKTGEPIIVTLISTVFCIGMAVGVIAITSLRKTK